MPLNALKEQFDGVNSYIFTNYRGLTVEQVTDLRDKLRAQNAEYHIVKNNLAKIAFKDMGNEGSGYLPGRSNRSSHGL